MNESKVITGILIDDNHSLSFVEVCQTCNLNQDELAEMLEHGLLNLQQKEINELKFNLEAINRIKKAARLQHDLGINLPGVILAIELLDELESMRKELIILKKY